MIPVPGYFLKFSLKGIRSLLRTLPFPPYEVEAMLELLEEKGVLTREEVLAKIQAMRGKTPGNSPQRHPERKRGYGIFPQPLLKTGRGERI
ncbi:MAG: hypothetical protein ACE5EK_06670 [Nitrospinales bacterium]